jgi:hypothetical protein
MKYTKPELVVLASATDAVQTVKGPDPHLDSNLQETIGMYEADE